MATADPMVPRVGRVLKRRRDAPQVYTLEIEEEGGAPAPFRPGQFNMLTVFGVGEVPISMSGDAEKTASFVHTVKAVGPVSEALVALRPGDPGGLRGPFGAGWPMAEAAGRDVIVVAGGLGLAPLRPALYHLLADRGRFGDQHTLGRAWSALRCCRWDGGARGRRGCQQAGDRDAFCRVLWRH